MEKTYTLSCDCGHEIKGKDARAVEAGMWHHAIHDHDDMVKSMSVDQFTEIMKGWDRQFSAAA
jgi:hypothetical protein